LRLYPTIEKRSVDRAAGRSKMEIEVVQKKYLFFFRVGCLKFIQEEYSNKKGCPIFQKNSLHSFCD
jgi:hypothetical protein